MVVFEELFRESNGKRVEYNGKVIQMMDEVAIGESARLRIEFDEVNSEWRQGISLTTEGTFEVGEQRIKRGLVLWQDTAPQQVDIVVSSKSGTLQVKNVWDIGDGVVHSWHNGAAMIVNRDGMRIRYQCNDGHADDDFDDMRFSLSVWER